MKEIMEVVSIFGSLAGTVSAVSAAALLILKKPKEWFKATIREESS